MEKKTDEESSNKFEINRSIRILTHGMETTIIIYENGLIFFFTV